MTGSRGTTMVMISLLVMAGWVSAQAAPSAVEQLTQVMPDDTMYFLAISGSDAVENACAKTAMGKLCADPGVRTFVDSVKTELLAALGREEGEEAPEIINMILQYVDLATNRPIIVGLAGVEVEEGPPACAFLILNAGPRKAEISTAVTKLEGMIQEEMDVIDTQVGSLAMHTLEDTDDVPLYWGWVGDYLVLALNDSKGMATKYVQSPRSAPTDHLNKVTGHGDILAVYYNVGKIWNTVQAFAKAEGGEKEIEHVKVALDKLGITKIGAVVGRVGVSGSEMVSDSYVEISGPRMGLLAAFKPINPSMLGTVTEQAMTASAFNLDLAHLFDTAMETLKAVSPDEGYPEVTEGLAEMEEELGFKVRDGLIKSLSGPAIVYTLPAGKMIEAPMGGIVILAKLNDPVLFEQTITQIGTIITRESEGMLQTSEQTGAQGRTTHVWTVAPLAIAQVLPTWSIVDDHVVIASNLPLCDMGIKQLAPQGTDPNSLLDTPGYKQVASKLPDNLLSITYIDSQVQFNQMVMQIQQFWPMATMFAMQAKIKLPVMLPALGHIAQEMQPAIEYAYARPDGIYSHYQGTGMEVTLRGVAGAALGAGVAMPALARTRVQARRTASMSHLKQLGLAVIMYADENDGKYPPDLATVKRYYLDDQVMESPRKPKGFDGPSYIYIAGHSAKTDRPAEMIVIYENPKICDEGANVVFLDGHVEFMRPWEFRRALEKTYEALGKEVPEVHFLGE